MSWGETEWLRKQLSQKVKEQGDATAKTIADQSAANQNAIIQSIPELTKNQVINAIPTIKVNTNLPNITGIIYGELRTSPVTYEGKGYLSFPNNGSHLIDNIDGVVPNKATDYASLSPMFMIPFSRTITIHTNSTGSKAYYVVIFIE